MFIEQLSEKELRENAKNYLSQIFIDYEAEQYINTSNIKRNKDCINFSLVDSEIEDFVSISDFDAIVICAESIMQSNITKTHRKNMYRKFGKNYLDALEKYERQSIEDKYQSDMAGVKNIIQEISSEEENTK